MLGVTNGWRAPGDKETSWWNAKVQEVINAKKNGKDDMGIHYEGNMTKIKGESNTLLRSGVS